MLRLQIICLLICLALPIALRSQAVSPDSLLKQCKATDSLEFALKVAQEAAEVFLEKNQPDSWAEAHICACRKLADRRKFEEAAIWMGKASATLPKLSNKASARFFMWYGYALSNSGQYQKATGVYEKAREEYTKAGPKSPDMAQFVIKPLANAYTRLGDYERSAYLLEEAMNISKTAGRNDLAALFYSDYGVAKVALGQAGEAINAYHAGLALEGVSPSTQVLLEINLGSSLTTKGEFVAARRVLESALKAEDTLLRAGALLGLGDLFARQKKHLEAEKYYLRTIRLYQKFYSSPYRREIGKVYCALSETFTEAGNTEKALGYAQQALQCVIPGFQDKDPRKNPLAEQYYQENTISEALSAKGNAWRKSYARTRNVADLREAVVCYDAALAMETYMLRTYDLESSQLSRLDYQYALVESALETAWQLYQVEGNLIWLEKAFEFAEKSRATLLQAGMQEASARSDLAISHEYTRRENYLKQQITEAEQELLELQQEELPEGDPAVIKAKGQLLRLRDSLSSFVRDLEKAFPDYYRLKYASLLAAPADIQALLAPDQALLEYFAGENALFIFVISRDKVDMRRVELPEGFSLEASVDSLRRGIYEYPLAPSGSDAKSRGIGWYKQLYLRHARQLYTLLWEPVAGLLPRRVLISPDGFLGYLPFEALLTKDASPETGYENMSYLIQNHIISYQYSGTLFLSFSQRRPSLAPAFALIAAPSYAGVANPENVTRGSLGPLPYSKDEAQFVRNYTSAQLRQGSDATRNDFMERAARYRLLHFTGHGIMNERNPRFSYLAFTAPGDSAAQGHLYLADLYRLQLDADMVVLSACETGIGKLYRGEGISSVARGFIQAGARSVITTLWSVNDKSSAELMNRFYELLAQGLSKDEALQQARLSVITRQAKSPFYWAGFVAVGDMGPVAFPNPWALWIWVAAGVVAVAGGAFLISRRERERRRRRG
ncbi:MAG: CHAT domain-containing protein [Bacteroidetes bacterium]|nr:MAG: CHAT domain-containing protein [Bacteroidota bacterium]